MLALPILLVKFTSYRGESFLADEPNIVPIVPFVDTGKGYIRYQLPVRAAYAMMLHKVQEMTLSSLVLDFSQSREREVAYVGISHVRAVGGLFLHLPLTLRNFTSAPAEEEDTEKHESFDQIAMEYTCLRGIYMQTI